MDLIRMVSRMCSFTAFGVREEQAIILCGFAVPQPLQAFLSASFFLTSPTANSF